MLNKTEKIFLVTLISVFSLIAGAQIAYSFTGTWNSIAPGSLEIQNINFTDAYRSGDNYTAWIETQISGANNSYSGHDFVIYYDGSNYRAINITGQMEYSSTNAYTTMQSAINATSVDASGDVVYNTTLRVKPRGSIFVSAGYYPLGANSLKFVNHLTIMGAGPSSTQISNDLLNGGIFAPMWSNFTYGFSLQNMNLLGLKAGGDEGIDVYASNAVLPDVTPGVADEMAYWIHLENLRLNEFYTPINITSNNGNDPDVRIINVMAAGRWFLQRIFDSMFTDIFAGQLNMTKLTDCHFTNVYVANGRVFLGGGTIANPSHGVILNNFRSDNPSNTPALTIWGYAYNIIVDGGKFTNKDDDGNNNVTSCILIKNNVWNVLITDNVIGNVEPATRTTDAWLYLLEIESGAHNITALGNHWILDDHSYQGRDAVFIEDGPAAQDVNIENRKQIFRGNSADSINAVKEYLPVEGTYVLGTTFNLRAVPFEMSGYFANLRVYKYANVPGGEVQTVTLAYENSLTGGAVANTTLAVTLGAGTSTGTDIGYYYYDPGARPDLVGYEIDSTDATNAGGLNCLVDWYPDLEDLILGFNVDP